MYAALAGPIGHEEPSYQQQNHHDKYTQDPYRQLAQQNTLDRSRQLAQRAALHEIYRTNVQSHERLISNAGACTAGEFALGVFLEQHRRNKPVRSLQYSRTLQTKE